VLGLGRVAAMSCGLDREDCAEVQWAESAGAEGAQRIKRCDDGVGILQEQAAGWCEGQDGAKRAVEGFYFDLAVAWEGCCALECEGKAI